MPGVGAGELELALKINESHIDITPRSPFHF
jgi:hypothetical protein